jgi:hypothetical protein
LSQATSLARAGSQEAKRLKKEKKAAKRLKKGVKTPADAPAPPEAPTASFDERMKALQALSKIEESPSPPPGGSAPPAVAADAEGSAGSAAAADAEAAGGGGDSGKKSGKAGGADDGGPVGPDGKRLGLGWTKEPHLAACGGGGAIGGAFGEGPETRVERKVRHSRPPSPRDT